MQDGDLDNYVRARGGQLLPEDIIMLKFVQICLAVHYIHSKVSLHSISSCHVPFTTHADAPSVYRTSIPAGLKHLDLPALLQYS